MIDFDIIESEIIDLEKRDTSYATVERLAWLYIVRAFGKGVSVKTTDSLSGSDFLNACSNVDYESLMTVLDSHMAALKIVCLKEYDSVMAKIRAL